MMDEIRNNSREGFKKNNVANNIYVDLNEQDDMYIDEPTLPMTPISSDIPEGKFLKSEVVESTSITPPRDQNENKNSVHEEEEGSATPLQINLNDNELKNQNVFYVFLAEFDIDKGSVLKYQYPRPTGVSESTFAELMLPEGAHSRESDFTVFFLNNDTITDPEFKILNGDENEERGEFREFVCVFSAVKTKMDSTVRRGAIVKALAICIRHRFYPVYKNILLTALDEYFEKPSLNILKKVYIAINNLDLSVLKFPQGVNMRVTRAHRLRMEAHNNSSIMHPLKLEWGKTKLPIKINMGLEVDEAGEPSLVKLIKVFKEQSMSIFTAVLCEKRVLILGHNECAEDLCNMVLSVCLLISPPLSGTLKRAFPYANLTNLDFINVTGYIAGVMNPIFEHRKEWWDVLCNLETGDVIISPTWQSTLEMSPLLKTNNVDNVFISKVLSGVNLKYGEEWTRCLFREYTNHLVSMTLGEEKFKDKESRIEQEQANKFRIAWLRNTNSFKNFCRRREFEILKSPFKNNDNLIRRHVRTLQVQPVNDDEVIQLFQDLLQHVRSPDQLLEFLALFPESHGGLFPVAVHLFHRHPRVRESSVLLLQRIDAIEEGSNSISSLNYFLLLAYHRYVREISLRQNPISPLSQDENGDKNNRGRPRASSVSPKRPPTNYNSFLRRSSIDSPVSSLSPKITFDFVEKNEEDRRQTSKTVDIKEIRKRINEKTHETL